MGGMIAPVVGSGSCPACIAVVPKPCFVESLTQRNASSSFSQIMHGSECLFHEKWTALWSSFIFFHSCRTNL